MHDFKYKNNALCCESVSVQAVAQSVGTPFYLYSSKTLLDHFHKIKKAFSSLDPIICFALKANDNSAVIKTLVDAGAGCDIVSGGELKKALKLKTAPKKIVFASVGKTEEEIISALKAGILFFNVESVPEIEEINRLAGQVNTIAPVALRINPDVDAATHQAITTGTLKNKFGLDLYSARHVLKDRKRFPFIHINGLHMHIGSQITTSQPYITALHKVIAFLEDLRREGIDLEYLDIGGGLGIVYKNEQPQTAKIFAKAVLPMLQKTKLKIVMEPGRFICGNAGIFVTQVLYLKDNGVKKFLIVDGGMNDLLRPSLYNAYHEIIPVKRSRKKTTKVDVVGPICESGDFLGKDRHLPLMKKGELLAVLGAGAYGFVMSSNYNVRTRVPEVLVKGSKFAIVREREKFSDLIRGEKIPDFLKKNG